ncbi:acyltransferase family protein [Legionella qingyii]|nr:acyltransferase [Legionella qingyii]
MVGEKERFGEIDLIRFCAALSVMIYHYQAKYIENSTENSALATCLYNFTKFGYLGVDLFFIISGFVIFASASGRTSFQFSISRITRIYPTYWVCVSITALIAIILEGTASQITFKYWLANLTLFNTRFGIEDIDGVYWTLGVEIKFYFFIFVLLVCNLLKYYRVWITIWLILTISFLLFKQPFFLGWFISPEYSSYFIAGIVFFLATRGGYQVFHIIILSITLLISSLRAMEAIDGFILHYGVSEIDRFIAVGVVWCLYFLFYLISIRKFIMRDTVFVLALGGITYPLYLLHNRAGKNIYDFFSGSTQRPFLLISIAILMLFVSLLIHLYLERKIADKLKFYLISAGEKAIYLYRKVDR